MSAPPPKRPPPPKAETPPSDEKFGIGDVIEIRARVVRVGPWPNDTEDALMVQLLNQDGSDNTRGGYPVIDLSTARKVTQ